MVTSDDVFAFVVPGPDAATIVSSGLLRHLGADEQEVVFAHERAHAEHRHDRYLTVGRAAEQADDLRARGVPLATTDAQAREAERVLHHVFGMSSARAAEEMRDTLAGLQLYHAPTYRAQEAAARARIHYKNSKDWPLLAAAIAHNAAIWTDDRDFFGTGVATWTTRNIRFWDRAA